MAPGNNATPLAATYKERLGALRMPGGVCSAGPPADLLTSLRPENRFPFGVKNGPRKQRHPPGRDL